VAKLWIKSNYISLSFNILVISALTPHCSHNFVNSSLIAGSQCSWVWSSKSEIVIKLGLETLQFLLLVIHYRVRVRVSKKETKIKETRNSILIIVDLKVVDLVKAFKDIGNISGVFKILDSSSNIRTTDARIATDLG
jgi:hypothetical protein